MNTSKKRIAFLTGTRADYGKTKSIMRAVDQSEKFEMFVFITGMHMHNEYGNTYDEIVKDAYKNVFMYINQRLGSSMDTVLSRTIEGFSAYVNEIKPDLIIVHGDRVEPLAAALVGAMNNILVGHIEGGEVSGNIDESIRHAITKLAHIHFVANDESKRRVIQLGESENRIFIVGSPDIDIMLSPNLPSWEEVKKRYDIDFNDFGIVLFHPVTTSYNNMSSYAKMFTRALLASDSNYVVIHPNNDIGREFIIEEYARLQNNERFRIFPSVRFEFFLTMLKQSNFIIGNSSVGIREASIYGTPAIDIGDRQKNRCLSAMAHITHCEYNTSAIVEAIRMQQTKSDRAFIFGTGRSTEGFMNVINDDSLWSLPLQKHFIDKE